MEYSENIAPTNEIVVNGVAIPHLVADQLKRLGVSLSWYSAGELEAAVQACSVDCTLIDDPGGKNFLDELVLDASEKAWLDETLRPQKKMYESFCKRILAQREEKALFPDLPDCA